MNYLIMFCGIPGSGKSTEARRMARSLTARNLMVEYISRDELRFSMISDESEYFSKEKEVFSKFVEKMNNSLNKNDCTIIDATHISKASRAKILRRVENPDNVRLLVLYLTTPFDVCMRQNDLRTGRKRVPHEAIEKMAEQFEEPTEKEFVGFGFDTVEVWEKPWKEGET